MYRSTRACGDLGGLRLSGSWSCGISKVIDGQAARYTYLVSRWTSFQLGFLQKRDTSPIVRQSLPAYRRSPAWCSSGATRPPFLRGASLAACPRVDILFSPSA